MKTLVGPVIGKVTETTARILLEYDSEGDVSVSLSSSNGSEAKTVTHKVEARRPTIFNFTDLIANTKYEAKISPDSNPVKSSFTTMKDVNAIKDMRICWLSCNDAAKNEGLKDVNLWYNLAEDIPKNTYDICVHMGDQVYLDYGAQNGKIENVYRKAKEVLKQQSKEDWPKQEESIRELIRDVYRKAWNFPPTAFVLANIPNIMIFDDHDIREDWGQRQEDWDPNTEKCDYFYGQQARYVYYEYQRQLWDEDIDLKDISKVKEEYFTLRFGKIGLFFAEVRGDKTWHRSADCDDSKMLSQAQWDKLDQTLKEGFKDIENFVFVSQSTVVFWNHIVNKLSIQNMDDGIEQWVVKQDEQIKLLKKLYDWKFQPGKSRREVSIVCGDVHLGGHTDIYYKNVCAFKQFTSSSITSVSKEKYSKLLMYLGNTISETIKGGFTFDHHDWTSKNNYGVTHIRNVHSNGIVLNTVECWNVQARDQADTKAEKFQLLTKFDNFTYVKDPVHSSCCNVF